MYFPDRGCIRPLRHLYGYATASAMAYRILAFPVTLKVIRLLQGFSNAI